MIKGNMQHHRILNSLAAWLVLGIWASLCLAGADSLGATSVQVEEGTTAPNARGVRRPTRTVPNPPAVLSDEAKREGLAGKRDPFKLPPPPRPGVANGPSDLAFGPLPPGTRGLVIGQLQLKGIVRQDATSAMLAVVTNYTNRAYFLRENDVLYNGAISKITPDSVHFRENYLGSDGRVQTREVIKRLGQSPGERR